MAASCRNLKVSITLEKGVPVLGIPPGTHDVQRLLYYNFVKCFWNDAFDFETNNMVNFDWYHPHDAWQHTEDEVAEWLRELNVTKYSFHRLEPERDLRSFDQMIIVFLIRRCSPR